MATQEFLNEFRRLRGALNDEEEEFISSLPGVGMESGLPGPSYNYNDYVEPGPQWRPDQPREKKKYSVDFILQVRDEMAEQAEEVRQSLLSNSEELFQDNSRLRDLGRSFFQSATPDELIQLANTDTSTLERDVARPASARDNDLVRRTRELLAGAPQADRQRFISAIRGGSRTVFEHMAGRAGVPPVIAGVVHDQTLNFLQRHQGVITDTLYNVGGMLASGFNDYGKMAALLGGLGLAGYGASRYFINDADEFVQEIEQAKNKGLILSDQEQSDLNKLSNFLMDVNTLGNNAAANNQLGNIDNLLVGSMVNLQNSQSTQERQQNLESINKLVYVKHYQLALYDKQLREATRPNPGPPKLKKNQFGDRPIRITPDWRGAII